MLNNFTKAKMYKLVLLFILYKILQAEDYARKTFDSQENFAHFWETNAAHTVKEKAVYTINTNVAKNVILFLGDGMSVPTLTATRVYMGGENVQLPFEKFPHTAISKTYCVNSQVADSACSSTAYLGGVKGNIRTIGVTANVQENDCEAMNNSSNHVQSIAQWAQIKGKSTGIVTTSTVTHASPAGVYAHTSQRHWESDTDVKSKSKDPYVCKDMATQLVTQKVGQNLNVIMGGGRRNFLPKKIKDEEGDKGSRSDGVNLIKEWKKIKKNTKARYIWNREQLINLKMNETDYVLGLFESGHCRYNLQRNKKLDPTLSEMTIAAIRLLSKNKNGYFLFVEGARIDMGHHDCRAHLALEETAEFSRAIELATNVTSEKDTLLVVTADHAHTMSISGYPSRGNNIFGLVDKKNATDGLPYPTLNYATGPGYREPNNGKRHNFSEDNLDDLEYKFPSLHPLNREAHGGDDVPIFAKGPYSHLFRGVMEQHVIPHLMGYASCLGSSVENACTETKTGANGGQIIASSLVVPIFFHVFT